MHSTIPGEMSGPDEDGTGSDGGTAASPAHRQAGVSALRSSHLRAAAAGPSRTRRRPRRATSYLYRLRGDSHLAEDLTQEVFCRALRQFLTGARIRSIPARLYRIARNLYLDHAKPGLAGGQG
jgi:hypothetical protein